MNAGSSPAEVKAFLASQNFDDQAQATFAKFDGEALLDLDKGGCSTTPL
jgi:hypothetical protein